jgi:hypothetical protein
MYMELLTFRLGGVFAPYEKSGKPSRSLVSVGCTTATPGNYELLRRVDIEY